MSAKSRLERGATYPYDASDEWWNGGALNPPPATDWAHAAARGVLADLQDRRGVKNGFVDIDEDVRAEMVRSLAEIIRTAKTGPNL